MQNFYHPARSQFGDGSVPHILGLTASPIMRSNPQELQSVPLVDLEESNEQTYRIKPRRHV